MSYIQCALFVFTIRHGPAERKKDISISRWWWIQRIVLGQHTYCSCNAGSVWRSGIWLQAAGGGGGPEMTLDAFFSLKLRCTLVANVIPKSFQIMYSRKLAFFLYQLEEQTQFFFYRIVFEGGHPDFILNSINSFFQSIWTSNDYLVILFEIWKSFYNCQLYV